MPTSDALAPLLVTGATGFLGRHLVPVLEERYGPEAVVAVGSADYDLMDPAAHARMYADIRPRAVVHLAAISGGLGANLERPADFFHQNAELTVHAFRLAAEHGVAKLVYPIAGCGYPADAESPITEDQIWAGYPHGASVGYSMAKKMGLVAAEVYRKQHGLETAVVLPGNMYGEYDNFRESESHVVAALVRRFHEARLAGAPEVACWGSGSPVRDFVYAGDVARVIPYFLEHDVPGPVNLCTGTGTTIRQLAEAVAAATGYQGRLAWDPSKPEGQAVKIFSAARLHELGLACPTPLEEGLARTAAWLAANYEDAGDGLRL